MPVQEELKTVYKWTINFQSLPKSILSINKLK